MSTPLQVLILEDCPADAELMVNELCGAGFDPRWQRVETEADFLSRLAAPPEVILSDFNMPCFNGLAALRHLQARGLDVPFIIVSGSVGEEKAVAAMKEGAADYLIKDRLGRLGQAVTQALSTRRLRQEQLQAVQAQRASEAHFRGAFEHTNVATVVTDLDNRFIRANAAFARLFGYSETEVLTRSMADITHPEDVGESLARRKALLAGEIPFFQIEKRYLHKLGHLLWGLTNVSLIRDAAGAPLHYVGQVQDITERKRAEEAIISYNERLRILHKIDRALIAGQAPAAIAAAALPHVRDLLGVGRVVVNLFHLATGEVEWLAAAGRRRVHVGPGVKYSLQFMGDVEALRRGEHQVVDVTKLPPGPETEALTASGVHSYVVVPMITRDELIGALSFGGGAAPLTQGQLDIGREVATQFAIALTQARLDERNRQQAQELKTQHQTLERVVSSSPAVIYSLAHKNGQFTVNWVSQNMINMMGYPAAEAIGKTWYGQHAHPEDAPWVFEGFNEIFASGHLVQEYRFRHKDGGYRWVRDEKRLVSKPGEPVEVVGSWADITERKQLEEQFRQAQKLEAIGKLAGGVAHDFNNLLTVIQGYSEVVLLQLSPKDPMHGFLEQIHKAGERATQLTRQLLAFSRKQLLQPVVLDLNMLLDDMGKMLKRLIGEDIELDVTCHEDLWLLKADAGQIEQVVMNLVINSRDAMPKGGKVTVETANVYLDAEYTAQHAGVRSGPFVCLTISDTGCGMDAATQERIFEPFFSTKGEKGTGLGLATVFGIVKQSGGHIDVHSEVGVGTAFKIYLPRYLAPESAEALRPTVVTVKTGSENILLAEDEPEVRKLAAMILRGMGYQVVEAGNGGEALLHCEQSTEPVHLLVTDVVMPKMNGRQLAERLAPLRPAMKVLYLSGYTDDAIVQHGVLESGMAFLNKPFSPEELARKVREVLDGSAANGQPKTATA